VKVPVVTDAEKLKRLPGPASAAANSTHALEPGIKKTAVAPGRGADQPYKEFRIVTFYDQSPSTAW